MENMASGIAPGCGAGRHWAGHRDTGCWAPAALWGPLCVSLSRTKSKPLIASAEQGDGVTHPVQQFGCTQPGTEAFPHSVQGAQGAAADTDLCAARSLLTPGFVHLVKPSAFLFLSDPDGMSYTGMFEMLSPVHHPLPTALV